MFLVCYSSVKIAVEPHLRGFPFTGRDARLVRPLPFGISDCAYRAEFSIEADARAVRPYLSSGCFKVYLITFCPFTIYTPRWFASWMRRPDRS